MMGHRSYCYATFAALTAVSLGANSCATEPDPLNRTQPEAVRKAMFQGEWSYNLTVTDATWDNQFTFIGEQVATYASQPVKLSWEITQDRLNGYMLPQRYRDQQGNLVQNEIGQRSIILSFAIKKHYDIRYRYNSTTREELNVIEENTDRPWNQREYMEVDWTRSLATNIWAPAAIEEAVGTVKREDVVAYDNIEFFGRGPDREHDVRIDPRKWDSERDPEVFVINLDTKESLTSRLDHPYALYYGKFQQPTTVRFRHSLVKAPSADAQTYQPKEFRDDVFRRFGYFRTEYNVYDNDRHMPTESTKRYWINRFDLSPGKQIVYYMSPDMQQLVDAGDKDLQTWTQTVVDAYDQVFKEATGRSDRIVELRPNERLLDEAGKQLTRRDGSTRWKYELGDLRYSLVNITKRQSNSEPAGYGPSVADPDTGELIQGTVNVYAGWIEWVVQRALDQYDVAAGHCTLEQIKNGRYFNVKSNACDGGTNQAPDDGPVDPDGKSTATVVWTALGGVAALGAPGDSALQNALMPALTPALKTAYWPSASITRPSDLAAIKARLQAAKPTLAALHTWEVTHPTQLNLGGFATIAGTRFESSLIPAANLKSLLPESQSADEPAVLAALSPAQRLTRGKLDGTRDMVTQSGLWRDEPTMFEPSIHAFVAEMKNKPRDEVERTLRHWIYTDTVMHEMGHTLGLRHNFAGSVDRKNFPAGYEPERKRYDDALEALQAKYADKIKAGDALAYEAYVREADALPAGHDRFGSSSIMDYTGDWMNWGEAIRPYDRAALLFGYGNQVEIREANKTTWTLSTYQPGDFVQADLYDQNAKAQSGRQVRTYMFCSDEKTFDDTFCTMFDRGVTATEIVTNFIKSAQINYVFANFKRDRSGFDGQRNSYYYTRWFRQYYQYAKPFAQLTLNSIRYSEFWPSLFDGLDRIATGPQARDMKPGYLKDGGEDLLRASLLYYYFLLYDVLMRPDYGYHQLEVDTSGELYWERSRSSSLPTDRPYVFIPAGTGWGFTDRWDVQQDPQRYDAYLKRIGVEVDKQIAYEILSIPMALNTPLTYEKANGTSYWSSLWTGNGSQLWQITRGLITDNFAHVENPWCIKCDGACHADPKAHPPELKVYPVGFLESLSRSGVVNGLPAPTGKTRCAGSDEHPVMPAMDALFAIKPMFYAIAGASHPWYHNALSEHLDSQVKGGNHRFDIPVGGDMVEFTNPSGTKTYQAVQTDDKMSISYALVDNARRINNRIRMVDACKSGKPIEGTNNLVGGYDRSCADILKCYGSGQKPSYCILEGWDSSFALEPLKYSSVDRIEAMLIMMQDMIDIAGHYDWRVPGYLHE